MREACRASRVRCRTTADRCRIDWRTGPADNLSKLDQTAATPVRHKATAPLPRRHVLARPKPHRRGLDLRQQWTPVAADLMVARISARRASFMAPSDCSSAISTR